MQTKYSTLTLGLGFAALAAALALPTPAEACYQVGPSPTFTVTFNSSLSPPGCVNATTFDNSTAANAYSAAQLALLSPSGPSGPSSPSSPGNFVELFDNAQDAFQQGNTAPGSQPFEATAIDIFNAASRAGLISESAPRPGSVEYAFGASDPLSNVGEYADSNNDGLPDNDQDADGYDDNTGEFLYSNLVEEIDKDRDGKVDADADVDGDGLPDNDLDADGYDDNTGEFLYSTLVEDIDRNRDGKVDADAAGCSGGSCDVAGFVDGLSDESCTGGTCDIGDIFDAGVQVADTGRISGFTLIEGGCDDGACAVDNWPNVMVQVLDLEGNSRSGVQIDHLHIEGSGGAIQSGLLIDSDATGNFDNGVDVDLGDDAPTVSSNDFYVNANPAVIDRRTGTSEQTGVRTPVIVSYESITAGLEGALINDGPGHSNQSRVILDNADDNAGTDASPAFAGEQFPWFVPNKVEITTVERGSATGGGGILNPDSYAVTVDNGVIQNISVVPLTIENGTVTGNSAGGLADHGTRLRARFTNVPANVTLVPGGSVSVPNSTVAGNTAGGAEPPERTYATDGEFQDALSDLAKKFGAAAERNQQRPK